MALSFASSVASSRASASSGWTEGTGRSSASSKSGDSKGWKKAAQKCRVIDKKSSVMQWLLEGKKEKLGFVSKVTHLMKKKSLMEMSRWKATKYLGGQAKVNAAWLGEVGKSWSRSAFFAAEAVLPGVCRTVVWAPPALGSAISSLASWMGQTAGLTTHNYKELSREDGEGGLKSPEYGSAGNGYIGDTREGSGHGRGETRRSDGRRRIDSGTSRPGRNRRDGEGGEDDSDEGPPHVVARGERRHGDRTSTGRYPKLKTNLTSCLLHEGTLKKEKRTRSRRNTLTRNTSQSNRPAYPRHPDTPNLSSAPDTQLSNQARNSRPHATHGSQLYKAGDDLSEYDDTGDEMSDNQDLTSHRRRGAQRSRGMSEYSSNGEDSETDVSDDGRGVRRRGSGIGDRYSGQRRSDRRHAGKGWESSRASRNQSPSRSQRPSGYVVKEATEADVDG